MAFDPLKTAQKLGVARDYVGVRAGKTAMAHGKGTWALKPKTKKVSYKNRATDEVKDVTTVSGGGLTDTGKAAVAGAGAAVVGGAVGSRRKKSNVTKSAFGVEEHIVSKAESSTSLRAKQQHHRKRESGYAAAGSAAYVGAAAGAIRNTRKTGAAVDQNFRGNAKNAQSTRMMGEAEREFKNANKVDSFSPKGNVRGFERAKATAAEAGKLSGQALDTDRKAYKLIRQAKTAKKVGVGSGVAAVGLLGAGVHHGAKADEYRGKAARAERRERKAAIGKSAFGVEDIEKAETKAGLNRQARQQETKSNRALAGSVATGAGAIGVSRVASRKYDDAYKTRSQARAFKMSSETGLLQAKAQAAQAKLSGNRAAFEHAKGTAWNAGHLAGEAKTIGEKADKLSQAAKKPRNAAFALAGGSLALSTKSSHHSAKAKDLRKKSRDLPTKGRTVSKSAFGVEGHEVSKAIRIPTKPGLKGSAYGNEKIKTMTGHLKRAGELGVKPKGSK